MLSPPSSRPGGAAAVAARIVAIAEHLPARVLTNEELAAEFVSWPADKILEKTGIRERRVAAEGETALDLGCEAARKLFEERPELRARVDFVILCTQAPDYVLPTSACLLQHRLGLPTHVGALDINLGCSGFVYGLSLAAGLIAAGAAGNVLLVTADTYSKFINLKDKSVRTLFGDGAAATLVSAADEDDPGGIGPFVFGSDGSGAHDLIVEAGGARMPLDDATGQEETDPFGNVRSRGNLHMNGAAVMSFTLREVPRLVDAMFAKTGTKAEDYDAFVLHQANKFMLDALQKKLDIPAAKIPRRFELIGNTVSSTIPFVLAPMLRNGELPAGSRVMLVGFGVGLSWAGATLTF